MTLMQAFALSVLACSPLAAQPAAESLPGALNYTRVEATVACGGATTAAAWPELRARGFKAVINLRQENEPGAGVPAAKSAAEAEGLRYIHIPMSSSKPDAAAVDAFLTAVRDPSNSPVYIHCASANRVGAVWLVKRMLVDGWDEARALAEAEAIGLKSAPLREFMLGYVRSHRAQ
jgi:uncharacterized protein (TIGR01244 family)